MAAHTTDSAATAPAFSRLETLTGVVVVGVLAVALGLVALVRPTQTVEQQTMGYTHSGAFDYAADAPARSPYGKEGLSAGEPILLDQLDDVTASFRYGLESETAAEVSGTARLVAEVELPQGLDREFEIVPVESFDGRTVTVNGVLPTEAIIRFVRRAQASFGDTSFLSAAVVLRATIKVKGTLDGQTLKTKYVPELPFALAGSTLSVNQVSGSAGGDGTAPLEQTEHDKIAFKVEDTNTVPLLIMDPTVPVARAVGFGVAGLCLLLVLWIARPFLGSGSAANERQRVRTLYGSRIIEVQDMGRHAGPTAQVASIDALSELAKKYESMIMHVPRSDGDSYLVWDNGLLYEFRPSGAESVDDRHGKHADQPKLNESSVATVNGKKKSPSKTRT